MAKSLAFEWDEAKAATNLARHGVAFTDAATFRFDLATIVLDERLVYGEERWIATAPLAGRIHVLVYTTRGTAIRVISLRKANAREIKRYADSFEA
ncbi:BrnT family toxin [Mangrovicella endophytica]|uniref:BrnT family toxin n=1 Tax=Mangrovicella endophytica TaxID=2066697 RepID=UPI000C9E52B5|nr:BrnT family toxin [Mangrovicella endophytica]